MKSTMNKILENDVDALMGYHGDGCRLVCEEKYSKDESYTFRSEQTKRVYVVMFDHSQGWWVVRGSDEL